MPNQFLSIAEVAASAASVVKWNSSEDRANIRHWIWIGERQLGYHYTGTVQERVDATDLCVEKPSDFKKLQDFALYDGEGNEIRARYRGFRTKVHKHNYDNIENTNATQVVEEAVTRVDVSEDDDFFYLGSNGTDVKCMVMRYWGIPLDEDQNPLIPEEHRMALMLFVKYMKALQDNNAQSEIARARQDWLLEAKRAKGINKMPNMKEGARIAKEWMSMIAQQIEQDQF